MPSPKLLLHKGYKHCFYTFEPKLAQSDDRFFPFSFLDPLPEREMEGYSHGANNRVIRGMST